MSAVFVPAGSADTNDDAVRQSNAAAWFNSVEGLLWGIDDQPRVTPANANATVLGFGNGLGVDVGVGNNGDFFIRGRTGSSDASGDTTSGQVATRRIAPGALLLIGLVAFLILKK